MKAIDTLNGSNSLLKKHNPPSIALPSSNYCHGVSVDSAKRWLHVSGQLGLHSDGSIGENPKIQMEQCWHNILAILHDAQMSKDNLVKITTYITSASLVPLYREVRDRKLNGLKCASTLVVVTALVDPNLVVEIEAVAAA